MPSFYLFMRMGKNLGLALAELDEMTPAMVIDAATYTINAQEQSHDTERAATQADYDSF